MRDREWRLDYGSTSLTFGPADLPIVNLSAPDLGDVAIAADDFDRPRSDGRAFGLDYRSGRTITFDLGVFGADEAEARASLATLARAWRADEVRRTPGATASLFVRYAGRERVVFGRPRRFGYSDEHSGNGAITATCDFAATDDVFYSADEKVVALGIVPGGGGGLVAPLSAPLSTTATSDRSTTIGVDGDLDSWPTMVVEGPIANPEVEVVGLWRIALQATIPAGQSVTIDARPWARSVLLNGSGSLAGSVTRDSVRLGAASIPPGSHEVVLRGTDATGTASLTFRYRDAFSSI